MAMDEHKSLDDFRNRLSNPEGLAAQYLAIEQKYVKAAYNLDKELSRFEIIHDYSKRLHGIEHDDEFYETLTEGIIDIFEMEVGAFWLFDEVQQVSTQPLVKVGDNLNILWTEIFHWFREKSIISVENTPLEFSTTTLLAPTDHLVNVQQLIAGPVSDRNSQPIGIIMGLVTRNNADFYEIQVKDCTSSFNVYSQLISTQLQQRKDHKTILHQLHEVQSASKAKSEFLSSMSHELRTPMNAIIGFAQLLQLSPDLSLDDMDSINEIAKAGDHLLSLINDVLDLSRIESGKLELSIEATEVGPLVSECLTLINKPADNMHLSLSEHGVEGLAVMADKIRLKQVLINLLSNAVKYNRKGGKITVSSSLSDDQSMVKIRVIDTGLGIEKEKIGKLFDPFERLDHANSSIEGTGIGLSITRKLLEMMNGSISVVSQANAGSTFCIELPVVKSSLITANSSPAKSALAYDMADKTLQEKTRKVVYIEDNPANLHLVERILSRKNGVKLISVHLPDIGISLIEEHRPDLVLLDISLPKMDGYEVLRILREEKGLGHIPVIAVTANAMPGDIKRGHEAGFSEYLTKPLNIAQFMATINKYLESS